MIRKFYDMAASDTEKKEEITPKFTVGEAFDAATLGVGVEENKFQKKEEVNDDEVEKKEEKVEDKKIEAKVENTEEKKIDDKKEEKKEEAKPVIQDWKESVKKAEHRKEIFQLLDIDEDALNLSKDLKSDEFVNKLVTYRKEHGNVTPFIEAATRDYDKVSLEQLVMDDLLKTYSHLPSDKAQKLAKVDFNQRFSYKDDADLSPEENTENAELIALKLESEGLKIRQAKKEEQKQFLDSVKPVDRTVDATKLAEEKANNEKLFKQQMEAMYDADPATQKLNAEKKIVLGKEKPFNYPVNPEAIKAQTVDVGNFYGKFWSKTDEGKEVFNTAAWNKMVAYSENPEAFEEALIGHGMSQQLKVVDDELENAKEKTDKTTGVKKESLAKAVGKGQAFSFNGQPVEN